MYYGNTVYGTQGDIYTSANGASDALVSNILMSKAGSRCVGGSVNPTTLIGNVYYALGGGTTVIRISNVDYTSLAALRGATSYESPPFGAIGDPLLFAPSSAPATGTLPGANVSTLAYFDLQVGSPVIKEAVTYTALRFERPACLIFTACRA